MNTGEGRDTEGGPGEGEEKEEGGKKSSEFLSLMANFPFVPIETNQYYLKGGWTI